MTFYLVTFYQAWELIPHQTLPRSLQQTSTENTETE
jgi:hypothetical protein